MYYTDEDEIRTKNHKTRLAKVELYLEVPTNGEDGVLGEDGTLALIENALSSKDITFTSFGDINLSPIFDDNIDNYVHPVGYLGPDGRFFVIESVEDGLAHLSLAHIVEEVYKDKIDYRYMNSTYGLDYDLEKAGFIKVHENSIRYLAHWPFHSFHDGWIDTPDPTYQQRKALVDYVRRFSLECRGESLISVNEREYEASNLIKILKEGDELAIRNVFNLH